MRKVPELSLLSYVKGSTNDQVKFVSQLFSGLKEYGFIILTDHTVKTEVINEGYNLVKKFFELPDDEKNKFSCPTGGGQRGYTSFGVEHAKNSLYPDLKEFWHVGREVEESHPFFKYYPKNIWPDSHLPHFRKALSELYESLDKTSVILLEAIGKGLDAPAGYFQEMVALGNSILRPIHYPPVDPNAPKNAVRSAAHEDVNLITILMGATASGLELLDRDGKWLPVETKEGQLIVDTGDMMSILTNDILPATTHRVVNPKGDFSSNRYSMPFFVHPHPNATLECLPSCKGSGEKYKPINSHEFLLKRLEEIGLMGGKK